MFDLLSKGFVPSSIGLRISGQHEEFLDSLQGLFRYLPIRGLIQRLLIRILGLLDLIVDHLPINPRQKSGANILTHYPPAASLAFLFDHLYMFTYLVHLFDEGGVETAHKLVSFMVISGGMRETLSDQALNTRL